jgi:hypothetical protein
VASRRAVLRRAASWRARLLAATPSGGKHGAESGRHSSAGGTAPIPLNRPREAQASDSWSSPNAATRSAAVVWPLLVRSGNHVDADAAVAACCSRTNAVTPAPLPSGHRNRASRRKEGRGDDFQNRPAAYAKVSSAVRARRSRLAPGSFGLLRLECRQLDHVVDKQPRTNAIVSKAPRLGSAGRVGGHRPAPPNVFPCSRSATACQASKVHLNGCASAPPGAAGLS